ncbi:DUF2637 domain-containing protein [Nonomuraea sp. NPDC003560]|uniref:DUF2637 domain-containing protein n=1 Tax=Nonomuraea sp. NPDC003560 TaxID=3364341 RepID=UPI0036C0920F
MATRRVAIAVVSVIAAVAAYVSFRHQHGLATSAGEPASTAWTLPVLIDGVIIMGSLVMLDASRRRHRSPWLARLALIAGAVATLAANVAHGWSGGLASSLISAVAPIVLVVAYELLMGMLRRSPHTGPVIDHRPVEEADAQPSEREEPEADRPEPVVPGTVEEAARFAYEASVLTREPLSERKLSDRFKLTRGAARAIIGEVADELVAITLQMQGKPPHPDQLVTRFGITERRAVELINARLTEQPAAPDDEPAEVHPATVQKRPVRWGDRVVPVPSQDVGMPASPEVRQRIAQMRNEALMNYGSESSASNGQAGEDQ